MFCGSKAQLFVQGYVRPLVICASGFDLQMISLLSSLPCSVCSKRVHWSPSLQNALPHSGKRKETAKTMSETTLTIYWHRPSSSSTIAWLHSLYKHNIASETARASPAFDLCPHFSKVPEWCNARHPWHLSKACLMPAPLDFELDLFWIKTTVDVDMGGPRGSQCCCYS